MAETWVDQANKFNLTQSGAASTSGFIQSPPKEPTLADMLKATLEQLRITNMVLLRIKGDAAQLKEPVSVSDEFEGCERRAAAAEKLATQLRDIAVELERRIGQL